MAAPILPIVIGAAAAVGMLALGGGGGSHVSKVPAGQNRKLLQELAGRMERALKWPGLAAFLDAAAYTESRHNPAAGPSGANNRARGWHGLRPESAFPAKTFGNLAQRKPNLVKHPYVDIAAITSYLLRTRRLGGGAELANMEELRASMAFPVFIRGRAQTSKKARYDASARRFRIALQKTGYPTNFAQQRAYPPGDRPTDVRQLLQLIGGNPSILQ